MLAGRREKRDVPHEEGSWVEFRTLSGRELDEAQLERSLRGLKILGELSPGAISALPNQARGEVDNYDKDTLIRYGVVAWSITEPCTDENKAMLDPATREWAAGVVLEMNTRPQGEAQGSVENLNGDTYRMNSVELTG